MYALVLLVTQIVPTADADADVVLAWNDAALAAVKADRTPPPLAARNLAMVHVAVYDAVNGIRRTHRPFRVDTAVVAGTSEETAASVAAHRVLRRLHPKQADTFDRLLERCLARVADGPAKEQGRDLGTLIADKTLEWRPASGWSAGKHDGAATDAAVFFRSPRNHCARPARPRGKDGACGGCR